MAPSPAWQQVVIWYVPIHGTAATTTLYRQLTFPVSVHPLEPGTTSPCLHSTSCFCIGEGWHNTPATHDGLLGSRTRTFLLLQVRLCAHSTTGGDDGSVSRTHGMVCQRVEAAEAAG